MRASQFPGTLRSTDAVDSMRWHSVSRLQSSERVWIMINDMKIETIRLLFALFILLLGSISPATAQETKIRWFGHAAFSITTPNGKVLLIDPWLNNPSNPEAKDGKDPLSAIAKVDYILLTH